MADEQFRVGFAREFELGKDESVFSHQSAARLLSHPGIILETLPADEVRTEDFDHFDAIVVKRTSVPGQIVPKGKSRTRLVARYGVGYDHIAVGACTRAGIVVTITPEGVRGPVASSVLTLMLALGHDLMRRDRLLKEGDWKRARAGIAQGLSGRTVGIIGFGNIGQEVLRLLRPFNVRALVYSPRAEEAEISAKGAKSVSLEELLKESDYVTVNCPLTDSTRHLIDAHKIGLMKKTAFLINTARGAIIDEDALFASLREGRIGGAGLDVFTNEPVSSDEKLLTLENVITTPHILSWTEEALVASSESVADAIIACAQGGKPANAVN